MKPRTIMCIAFPAYRNTFYCSLRSHVLREPNVTKSGKLTNVERAYRVGGSDVTQDGVKAHSSTPRLALETTDGGRDACAGHQRRRTRHELVICATHIHRIVKVS